MRLLVGVVISFATVAMAAESLPPTAEVMTELRKIEAAVVRNDVDSMRLKYNELSRQKPAESMPRVYLAWLSMPSDDAWNQLKAISTIYPDNPWVRYGMGRVYIGWKGMTGLAQPEFEAVLKKDPKFFPALVGLGDLARSKGDLATAESKYREALAINDDAFAHAGLGLTLAAQKKDADALKELKRAIEQQPEQPAALNVLIALSTAAKDPSTIKAAAALADLKPKDRDARKKLADLRFDAGDKAGAAKEYDRLVRLGDPEVAVVKRLAALDRELGDTEGEERALQSQAAFDAKSPEANLRLAEIKLARKDQEGAEAQWLEAIARDPNQSVAFIGIAKLKIDQGKSYEALENYRSALKVDPANAEAKAEVTRLTQEFKLPKRNFAGSFNHIYFAVEASLGKLYEEKKAARPALAGIIKVRVRVLKSGVADGVDVLEDTLKDPALIGHVYFTLKDAEYPKQKSEPIYEFVLGKVKKAK